MAKGNVCREAAMGEIGKLDLGELVLPQEKQNEISFARMPQEEDGGVCLKKRKKPKPNRNEQTRKTSCTPYFNLRL